MEALDKAYKIGLDAENREEMEKLAEEFAAIDPRSQSVFSGTVMAIDGWVMQTRKPYDDETTNVKSYRNRKGMWGLVVLAGCDARTRFTLWNVNNTGSNNDISAWNNSALKKVLEDHKLHSDFYFIGDEAFTCGNQFLVPWGGTGIGVAKDTFNHCLSVRRQVIERAFGILVQRWGILWRPIVCSITRWTLIANVCAKLHNVCVDRNIPQIPRFVHDWVIGDSDAVYLNGFHEEDPNRTGIAHGLTTGSRRKTMTDQLYQMGVRRPRTSIANSRA